MADPDIPVAIGTPIPPLTTMDNLPIATASVATTTATANGSSAPPRDLRMATQLNGGRSSRISLPTGGQEHAPLSKSALQALQEQGFTLGLATALSRNKLALPLQMWVVDNSGSMATRDGHRLVVNPRSRHHHELRVVECTRWTELQQTVEYHAQLAALLQSPCVFRLLNDPGRVAGPQQFSIAERGATFIDEDLAIVTSTIQNAQPGGVTPLISHLQEIRQNVIALQPSLRANGAKVAVILATDGIPTDERGYTSPELKQLFAEAMRSFQGLPVWMVIRLCTDEDAVVDFWNSVDANLELSLEVLDDFLSEAQEVHQHNPWLNYGLPLHRMRELGFHARVFDQLDERPLSKDELTDFFKILLGDDLMRNLVDPEVDWKEFAAGLSNLIQQESKQWNPMTKRMEYWVDMAKLKKQYGGSWFSSIW